MDSLLTKAWVDRLAPLKTLWLGYSGGLDSTVLLHSLLQHAVLKCKLHVLHVNDQCHPSAEDWLVHCEQMCAALAVPIKIVRVGPVKGPNLEARSRNLRYQQFQACLQENEALLLAHHVDDQAETVLLNLLRGAGIEGLAAMPESRPLGQGVLMRPFLNDTRQRLQAYAAFHQLSWIEDPMNADLQRSRNFIRHQVLPLLEERWPKAQCTLTRAAMHCQKARDHLIQLAHIDAAGLDLTASHLPLIPLKDLPQSRFTQVLRVWLSYQLPRPPSEKLCRGLLDSVISSRQDAKATLQWGDIEIRRYHDVLYSISLAKSTAFLYDWPTFPAPLKLNHRQWIEPVLSETGFFYQGSLPITIRSRQGGERFRWHGQQKCLKKLLQAWQIPPWQRSTMPLLYVGDVLAAVVGYAISDDFWGHAPLPCYQFHRCVYNG